MSNQKNELAATGEMQIDEAQMFQRVAGIIENRKARAGAYANSEVTLMYWEVGHYVNSVVLDSSRAAYGKRIVSTLSKQLIARFGRTFDIQNLRRMMRFAERFHDFEIVSTLSKQLSWSHFAEVLTQKTYEARLYYAMDSAQRNLSIRGLRSQIARKAYERREIANTRITENNAIPFNAFKDPYLLDVLGLKDNYEEADLEKAILIELQAFILEFGSGITFSARKKRITIDGEDYYLDLLFFSRDLRRLIAVELKIGKFKPAYKAQMEVYLKWLDQYEKRDGENPPIGLILCPTASRELVEMLELGKSGIAVAEYWTHLPPKAELERKIREILEEAKERLARRKLLTGSDIQREIEYFYDPKDDDDD